MNTLKGRDPILAQDKSKLIFDDKDIDFGFPQWQLNHILELWQSGKGIVAISEQVKRNQHEVFLALYESWMEGKISNIGRAFFAGSNLLVPGKKQKTRKKGGITNENN